MSLYPVCVVSAGERMVAVRYFLVATVADFVWEIAQLPLYAIWRTGTWGELAYAVIHCTAGDAIVLTAALLLALLLTGKKAWPRQGYARVALTATVLGASYTVFSEWLNVDVWRNWVYAPAMPLLPPLGTGLTPFLQWLIIPPLAAALVRPARGSDVRKRTTSAEMDRRQAEENVQRH